MAKFFDKLKDVIFDPDPVDDSQIIAEDIMDVDNDGMQAVKDEKDTSRRANKVVNIEKPNLTAVQGAGAMKMILFQPLSYEDSQAIVDNLRARKPVIVNMVDLERECAQRVLDFMAGAVYALSGTIRRVSYGIFVIVPSNVSIVGNGDNEEDEKELFRS